MSISTIILIVVFVFCAVVLLWCIKNGNNIKLGKDGKKVKDKKSAEDKFKDVIPKEKKEKIKKEPIIRNSVKEDIKKNAEANKTVEKITKEDFANNDMNIPTALLSDEEKTAKAKEIAKQGKPALPKGFDFNFDNEFKPLKSPMSDNPFKFDDDLDSLFSAPLKPSSTQPKELPSQPIDFMDMEFDFDALDKEPPQVVGKEAFDGADITERFKKVFGTNGSVSSAKNEVIIGDVLSQPRSRTNRMNRRKYF